MPALFMKKTSINRRELEFETLVMDERNGIDCFPFTNPVAVKLEHSCNGLILFEVRDESTGYHTTYYVIYNPSKKRFKTLPSPPFRIDPVVGACSADISKDVFHIEIYSYKTDYWRDAGDPFPFSAPGILSVFSVYWNASVHWINQLTETLHYFDIDCEAMKTVAMPRQSYSEGDYSRHIVYFGECRGHMHLMEMLKDDIPHFDIWEMRMDYSGWNIEFYVERPQSLLLQNLQQLFS
ncbi:F-box protein At5g07610-like [Papaver somniferum]|uniref:F-box protein At5g07610-like n=1 Tax=Papaver somniferum TaxID=3469 RepID=UPI000E6FD741|nr:F-box protein At5g07610-like [Papaver somniferum]